MAVVRCACESSVRSSVNGRCPIPACPTPFEPICNSCRLSPDIGVRRRWVDSLSQPRHRRRRLIRQSSARCCSPSGPRTNTDDDGQRGTEEHGPRATENTGHGPRKNTDLHGLGHHTNVDEQATTLDRYNLTRFTRAQESDYEQALSEIRSGRKRSHWMWYVFPQFAGLGTSPTAQRYAIQSVEEARAYLAHPVLGPRLVECAEAVLGVAGRSATEIFGSPDDLKLRSSATLFATVSPPGSVFGRVLAKYYGGGADERTLRLIGIEPGAKSAS